MTFSDSPMLPRCTEARSFEMVAGSFGDELGCALGAAVPSPALWASDTKLRSLVGRARERLMVPQVAAECRGEAVVRTSDVPPPPDQLLTPALSGIRLYIYILK